MPEPNAEIVRSGFADEISDDLETQLDVVEELGLERIDLRSVEATNVLDFSQDQIERIRAALDDRGIEVASIGSPIGKIDIGDEFAGHLERFETAIEMANTFDTPYIRLFSYWMPEDEDPESYREEVLRRMEAKVELAEAEDVVLLHENEKDIYGDTPARCRDLLETIDSPNFKAIFDPANFLEIGVQPYPDALLDLIEHVELLHIKDGTFGERHSAVPAGAGDGNIPELVEAFRRRNFRGYASLEPHLKDASSKGGYSGPEAFRVASEAFDGILDEAGLAYH